MTTKKQKQDSSMFLTTLEKMLELVKDFGYSDYDVRNFIYFTLHIKEEGKIYVFRDVAFEIKKNNIVTYRYKQGGLMEEEHLNYVPLISVLQTIVDQKILSEQEIRDIFENYIIYRKYHIVFITSCDNNFLILKDIVYKQIRGSYEYEPLKYDLPD
jgi:S-adenosylmethionine hydrolase